MKVVSGSLAPIDAGQTIVDDQTASDRGLAVGGTVTIRTARGEPEQMTIVGTYERSAVTVSGFVVSPSAAAAGFASPGSEPGLRRRGAGSQWWTPRWSEVQGRRCRTAPR